MAMSFDKLTQSQKQHAHRLNKALFAQGVPDATVSQVGVHYEWACAWEAGEIDLYTLCRRAEWKITAKPGDSAAEPLERVRDRAARIKLIVAQLADERAALREDMDAADANGDSRNSIVEAAEGALSRGKVFEHFGYRDARTLTEEVLKSSGLAEDYEVYLSEKPAGQLNILVEEKQPIDFGDPDEEDLYPQETAREAKRREEALWVDRMNAIGHFLGLMRKRGLVVEGKGDKLNTKEDLASGAPAVITLKRP